MRKTRFHYELKIRETEVESLKDYSGVKKKVEDLWADQEKDDSIK